MNPKQAVPGKVKSGKTLPKKMLLNVLASAALLATGVMTDPTGDAVVQRPSASCPMIGSTDVVCQRPAAPYPAPASARMR